MLPRALACLALLAAPAAAETKSYAAVKAKLAPTTTFVGGIDVKAMRASPSFPKLAAALVAIDKDIPKMIELVKSTCAIDPLTALADITVAGDFDEHGVVVIGFDGLDEQKVVGCITKTIGKVDPGIKLTSKPGKITEYTFTDTDRPKEKPELLYAAWLAKDVVAIGLRAQSREALDAMFAGKPATGDLAAFLAKVNTGAIGFGAASINKDGVKGGYGTVQSTKGTATIAGKLVAVDAKTADKLLADARKDLAKQQKRAEQRAPAAVPALKSVKLDGKGAEISFELSSPEADLPTVLPALDKVF